MVKSVLDNPLNRVFRVYRIIINKMKNIDIIIAKSLLGTATEEELDQLHEWMGQNSGREQLFQDLHRFWHAEAAKDDQEIAEKWQELRIRIETETSTLDKIEKVKTRAFNRRKIIRWDVAAAVILAVLTVAMWMWYSRDNTNTMLPPMVNKG